MTDNMPPESEKPQLEIKPLPPIRETQDTISPQKPRDVHNYFQVPTTDYESGPYSTTPTTYKELDSPPSGNHTVNMNFDLEDRSETKDSFDDLRREAREAEEAMKKAQEDSEDQKEKVLEGANPVAEMQMEPISSQTEDQQFDEFLQTPEAQELTELMNKAIEASEKKKLMHEMLMKYRSFQRSENGGSPNDANGGTTRRENIVEDRNLPGWKFSNPGEMLKRLLGIDPKDSNQN